MPLNSLTFLAFFTLLLIPYWLSSKKQWLVLLGFSYLFYFSWQPVFGALLIITTLISFFVAQKIDLRNQNQKWWLVAGLLYLFSILFTFKYLNFAIQILSDTLPIFASLTHSARLNWLLPIGISFYTFLTAGYLIDVYRRNITAEKNLGQYFLFVSFFPLISSGPIERAGHLLPQLKAPHHFKYQQVVSGMQLFLIGLFKKMVIADNLGIVVTRVFSAQENYKGLSLLITIFLFSWQIYADFSGYTDMARGVARILGIDILENFKTPYFASSVRDFWRRWHITLSTWLRDYLYIPLGGSKKSEVITYLNTIIVFLACGLWHGASWTFVFWGLSHGIMIAAERAFSKINWLKIKIPTFVTQIFTFTFITLTWILFRAKDLNQATYFFKNIFVGISNFLSPNYIWASVNQIFLNNPLEIFISLFCLISIVLIELFSRKNSIEETIGRQPMMIRWSTYLFLATSILLLRNAHMTQFIYQQF